MRLSTDAIGFGGVYHAEQWGPDTWTDDVRLMKQAGVNLVSLALFAWAEIEKSEGEFDFEWLDRVIENVHGAGIEVLLGTATSTPPTWLLRKHPEILPRDEFGITLETGARQAYCPSSPVWKEHVQRMTRAMAARYGNHPAVVLWQVSHEYSDHLGACYCDVSADHFRSWLQNRYESIDALNDAWGTSNWSQRITSWDDVIPPRATVNGPKIPGQVLDFERFSSDAFIELFKLEMEILDEVSPNIPVTTHFISLRRDLNYWKFATSVDVIADNAYPDPADPFTHEPAALNYDLMRSLHRGKPWLMLEHPMSSVAWRDVNPPKPAGQAQLTVLQAVARGADCVLVNQWRQSRFGAEQFHSAVLGHRGEASRTYQEFTAIGEVLEKIQGVKGGHIEARVAIAVDWDSWWASSEKDTLPSTLKSWLETTRSWHAALTSLGVTVDVVPIDDRIADYDLICVPNLAIVTVEQASNIHTYVEQGGSLCIGSFSGVMNTEGHVHEGGAPGPLRDLLGIEVDEFWPLSAGATTEVTFAEGAVRTLHTQVWNEHVHAEPSTTVVATYGGADLNGRPALTRTEVGTGTAWYVSFDTDHAGLRELFQDVCTRAGIDVMTDKPRSIEIVRRGGPDGSYVFVLNHGRERTELSVADLPISAGATDLLTGTPCGDLVTLEEFQVMVFASGE